MEAFPAYTWSTLNDEDPAFMRALLIRAVGVGRDDEFEEEVDDD